MDERPAPPPIFELFTEIGIIAQLSRARLEARLPDGLIQPHFSVLNHLVRVRDGAMPVRMAAAFQVPKTSLTHTLKGLVTRGLVEMRANPGDGRSRRVWITDKGRALRQEVIAQMAADFGDIGGKVDVAALLAARPALAELRAAMDAARDAEDFPDP